MRIAYLSFNYKPLETDPHRWLEKIRFYNGTLEALAAHATVYNIDLINWEGAFIDNGVQYIFPAAHLIASALKKIDPDVVIVHGLVTPEKIISLRLLHGMKRIVVQHHAERPLRGIKGVLQRIANGFVERYFFSTHTMADQWAKTNLISRKKVQALPEASSVFYTTDKETSRKISGVNGELNYLWVGRLNENKDPLTVIDAFARFVKNNKGYMLYMIYSSAELEVDMRKRIAASGMNGNIILVGKVQQEDLLHWYNSADFIINSSYYEGCNIAVLEGMSCGCIPIVTNIASFDLHTDNGKIGMQFEPGSINALVECLDRSTKLEIEIEQKKVLAYFTEHLSFRAIAAKVYSVISVSE